MFFIGDRSREMSPTAEDPQTEVETGGSDPPFRLVDIEDDDEPQVSQKARQPLGEFRGLTSDMENRSKVKFSMGKYFC